MAVVLLVVTLARRLAWAEATVSGPRVSRVPVAFTV